MTSRTKKVLIVLGVLWGIPALLCAGVAWWVHQTGTVSVEVSEHRPGGSDVRIHVPGALAQTCLWLIPDVAIEEAGRDLEHAGPAAGVIRALSRELKDCPDAVFVDIVSADETVRVAKQNRHLLVDVESADETVHLRVPIAVVATALSRIDDKGCGRICLGNRRTDGGKKLTVGI